jgi:hypothetical protein
MSDAFLRHRLVPFVVLLAVTLTASAEAKAPKPPSQPAPLADAQPVSGCATCETWFPILEATVGDDVLVAWHPLHDDLNIQLDRFGTDGFTTGHVATLTATQFLEFCGAERDGDEWLAAWRVGGTFNLRRFSDGGAPATPVIQTNADTPAGQQDRALTLRARDGRVLLAWERVAGSGAVNSVLAAWFDRDGNRVTEPAVVGESFGLVNNLTCIRPDGSAVVAFNVQGEPPPPAGAPAVGLAIRRLGADGRPLGATTLLAAPAHLAGGRTFAVACSKDGSYTALWSTATAPAKKGTDVVWQRFDAAGKAKGKVQLLNSGLDGDQFGPKIIVRPDGSFLVTWLSVEAGADVVKGRRFTAQGKPQGNDFVLRSGEPGTVEFPIVIAPPEGGRFALGWWERRVGLLQWFRD